MKEEENIQKRYGEVREKKIKVNRQYIKHEGFIEENRYITKKRKKQIKRLKYHRHVTFTFPIV